MGAGTKRACITVAGFIGILVFSLFEWVNIPIIYEHTMDFNLFNIWRKAENADLRFFLENLSTLGNLRIFMLVPAVMLASAFILLILSLVKHQPKNKKLFACRGARERL